MQNFLKSLLVASFWLQSTIEPELFYLVIETNLQSQYHRWIYYSIFFQQSIACLTKSNSSQLSYWNRPYYAHLFWQVQSRIECLVDYI